MSTHPDPRYPYADTRARAEQQRVWMDEEWARLLKRKQEMLRVAEKRDAVLASMPVNDEYAPLARAAVEQVVPDQSNTQLPDDWDELRGAAELYGIPNPEKVPPGILKQMIAGARERRRTEGKEASDYIDTQFWGEPGQATSVGLGAVSEVVSLASNAPFLGPALRRRGVVQEAEQWLGKMNEAYRGDLEGEDVEGIPDVVMGALSGNEVAQHEFAKGIGALGTYFTAGGVYWKAFSRVTGIAKGAGNYGRASAITRGALAGSLTEATLEGGSTDPIEDKILYTLLGAIGGGAAVRGLRAELMAGGMGIGAGLGWSTGEDIDDKIKGAVIGVGAFAMLPRLLSRAKKSFPTSGLKTGSAAEEVVGAAPGPAGPSTDFGGPQPSAAGPFEARSTGGPYTVVDERLRQIEPPIQEAEWTGVGVQRSAMVSREVARADAVALTKHTSIMESPALADMAQQPRFDDGDVARALVASRPAAVNVVRNIGDHGKFIRTMLMSQLEGGVGPQDFRLIDMPDGTTDVLVRGARGISNKIVDQYKKYNGMFTGRRASAGGTEVEILRPAGPDGIARVRSLIGQQEFDVPANGLQLERSSTGEFDAPETYAEFRGYVQQYMDSEGAAQGMPSVDWLSPQTSSILPELMEQFFQLRGVNDDVAKAAIGEYFERQRVMDFRSLAPDEFAAMDAVRQQASQAMTERAVKGLPSASSDVRVAAMEKGLEITEIEGGYRVWVNRASDEYEDVVDEAAAMQFVSDFNRELPDLAPVMNVPVELMEGVPGAPHIGTSGGRTSLRVAIDDIADNIRGRTQRLADDIDAENDAVAGTAVAGESGMPPRPPTGGLPPGQYNMGGGYGPRRLGAGYYSMPGSTQLTLGQQFKMLHRSNPKRLDAALSAMKSDAAQWFHTMRNYAIKMERTLGQAGVENDYYTQYSNITHAETVAHNERAPHIERLGGLLERIRFRNVDDGTLLKVMEAPNWNDKLRLMKEKNFSSDQIKAVNELRTFVDELHGMANQDGFEVGYLFDYMPMLRQAADRTPDPFADPLFSNVSGDPFFEHIREGNFDVREQNVSKLLVNWIHGWQYAKHVAPHVDNFKTTWVENPDVPTDIRTISNDWLRTMRFGTGAETEVAVEAMTKTANLVGMPLVADDIVTLLRAGMTAMYRNFLGFRPDALFRDSFQLFLTGMRVGYTETGAALRDFVTNPELRREIWETAVAEGTVRVNTPRTAMEGMFGNDATNYGGLRARQNAIELITNTDDRIAAQAKLDAFMKRREAFKELTYKATDIAPRVFGRGIQGTWMDPLKGYAMLGDMLRAVSAHAGRTKAQAALAKFRGGEIDMKGLMDLSGAEAWPSPIQAQFMRAVESGADDAAASVLAKEAANMQMRYGAHEQSLKVQKAGVVGKMGMMLGSFPQQFTNFMHEIATAGVSDKERTRFLARVGGFTAATAATWAASEWNVWKMHPAVSVVFSGGPPVDWLVFAHNAIQGVPAALKDEYAGVAEAAAAEAVLNPDLVGMATGFAGNFNPLGGGMRTVQNVADAFSTPNPTESLPRFLTTGERPRKVGEEQHLEWREDRAIQHVNNLEQLMRQKGSPGGGAIQ